MYDTILAATSTQPSTAQYTHLTPCETARPRFLIVLIVGNRKCLRVYMSFPTTATASTTRENTLHVHIGLDLRRVVL